MPQPTYPIETERLILRPYEAGDLDTVYDIHSRPDVVRYLYWSAKTREEAKEMLERDMKRTSFEPDSSGVKLAVVRKDTGQCIGDVSVFWFNKEHLQGEFGFIFHPDHHGKGFATEAAQVMLDLGFGEFGLHRIVGRLDARNTASAKVLERLGLRLEAHFRENELFKGEWGDELVYAMLASEWRERRSA